MIWLPWKRKERAIQSLEQRENLAFARIEGRFDELKRQFERARDKEDDENQVFHCGFVLYAMVEIQPDEFKPFLWGAHSVVNRRSARDNLDFSNQYYSNLKDCHLMTYGPCAFLDVSAGAYSVSGPSISKHALIDKLHMSQVLRVRMSLVT